MIELFFIQPQQPENLGGGWAEAIAKIADFGTSISNGVTKIKSKRQDMAYGQLATDLAEIKGTKDNVENDIRAIDKIIDTYKPSQKVKDIYAQIIKKQGDLNDSLELQKTAENELATWNQMGFIAQKLATVGEDHYNGQVNDANMLVNQNYEDIRILIFNIKDVIKQEFSNPQPSAGAGNKSDADAAQLGKKIVFGVVGTIVLVGGGFAAYKFLK